MRKLVIFFILFANIAKAQLLPDSVVIIHNTYVGSFFNDDEKIYSTETFSIIHEENKYELNGKQIPQSSIRSLLKEMLRQDNYNNYLSKYKVDTNWIKRNPKKLLKFYKDKKDFDWNGEQISLIYKRLTKTDNYYTELKEYLSEGCCYTMHHSYRDEFIIKIYFEGEIKYQLKSRKYAWGLAMPWTDLKGDTVYNYNIADKIREIIFPDNKPVKILKGKQFIKYAVNKICRDNEGILNQLAANSFTKEINELKTDFDILSSAETYTYNGSNAINVSLKNDLMLNNVSLNFYATKFSKTNIYSRDSLKRDYKNLINRIQSINFITGFLKSNPDTKLEIFYFDNKGIDKYNEESVNGTPQKWAEQNKYVKSFEWYKEAKIKPSFDTSEAIKTSERLNCGCNYRFGKEFIERAVLFTLKDPAEGNYSTWFLLPDNTVLLHFMQGNNVLNYSYKDFGNSKGMQYPCVLFDINGKIIKK